MFLPTLSGYSTVSNSASNQINIGAIGINGMGWGNVQKALEVPGVKLVAVCDVDENVIKRRLNSKLSNWSSAKQEINLKAGHKINTPEHLFEVISDEQINAEIEKLK